LIISLDNVHIPNVSFTNIMQRIHDEGRSIRAIFRGPDHYSVAADEGNGHGDKDKWNGSIPRDNGVAAMF
jgi:hypothetical protein